LSGQTLLEDVSCSKTAHHPKRFYEPDINWQIYSNAPIQFWHRDMTGLIERPFVEATGNKPFLTPCISKSFGQPGLLALRS
jgi:hypothetical protein